MQKPLFLLVIGLFFGAGLGFVFGMGSGGGAAVHSHDHAATMTHDMPLDIAGQGPVPAVTLDVTREGDGAFNLHIVTENFTFTPEAVNGPHAPNQGHAHVYVDGVKYMRTYGPWVHLSGLPDDAMQVRVTLNANSHEPLADGDRLIEATALLAGE